MKLLKRWLYKIQTRIELWSRPDKEELILKLVQGTASLELAKSEYIQLAPIMPGQCGPFRLSGNSLPVFEYTMFEKKIMEFIKVRVEVSRKPARIEYITYITSTPTEPRNEEIVECTARYREPFERLSLQLYRYFPYSPKALDPDRADRVKVLNAQ